MKNRFRIWTLLAVAGAQWGCGRPAPAPAPTAAPAVAPPAITAPSPTEFGGPAIDPLPDRIQDYGSLEKFTRRCLRSGVRNFLSQRYARHDVPAPRVYSDAWTPPGSQDRLVLLEKFDLTEFRMPGDPYSLLGVGLVAAEKYTGLLRRPAPAILTWIEREFDRPGPVPSDTWELPAGLPTLHYEVRSFDEFRTAEGKPVRFRTAPAFANLYFSLPRDLGDRVAFVSERTGGPVPFTFNVEEYLYCLVAGAQTDEALLPPPRAEEFRDVTPDHARLGKILAAWYEKSPAANSPDPQSRADWKAAEWDVLRAASGALYEEFLRAPLDDAFFAALTAWGKKFPRSLERFWFLVGNTFQRETRTYLARSPSPLLRLLARQLGTMIFLKLHYGAGPTSGFQRGMRFVHINLRNLRRADFYFRYVRENLRSVDPELATGQSIANNVYWSEYFASVVTRPDDFNDDVRARLRWWLAAHFQRAYLAELRAWAIALNLYCSGLRESHRDLRAEALLALRRPDEPLLTFVNRELSARYPNPDAGVFALPAVAEATRRLRAEIDHGTRWLDLPYAEPYLSLSYCD